jgi:hypothetical protein
MLLAQRRVLDWCTELCVGFRMLTRSVTVQFAQVWRPKHRCCEVYHILRQVLCPTNVKLSLVVFAPVAPREQYQPAFGSIDLDRVEC